MFVDRGAVLGRAEHRPGRSFHEGSGEADGGAVEVDVGPAQRQELAAAGARRGGEVQIGEEGDVGFVNDAEGTAHRLHRSGPDGGRFDPGR